MENAGNAATAGSSGQIVVAGAGYAGLHVALRLTAKLRSHPAVQLTLVDRHDYHQAITELPRVAAGTRAEQEGRPLEAFTFHDKGFVVSVGTRRGVADITTGGRLAHLLKDAIEWEYRQSVRHLRGWDPVAV